MKVTSNMNDSGFTLLESLLALMLSMTILLLLVSGILQLGKIHELVVSEAQTISSSANRVFENRQIEWHIFLNQLENNLKNTKLISHSSNQIQVIEINKKNGKEQNIRYGQAYTGNKNFYRNNNNGYNEMLTGIQTFHLNVSADYLTLLFTFQNGEQYEGMLRIENWRED